MKLLNSECCILSRLCVVVDNASSRVSPGKVGNIIIPTVAKNFLPGRLTNTVIVVDAFVNLTLLTCRCHIESVKIYVCYS